MNGMNGMNRLNRLNRLNLTGASMTCCFLEPCQ